LSQAGAIFNTEVVTNPSSFTNTVNLQTIFKRVTDANSTASWDTSYFDLIVSYASITVTFTPLKVCEANLDGFEVFDFVSKDVEIRNGLPFGQLTR
jgi:hypothetical protein